MLKINAKGRVSCGEEGRRSSIIATEAITHEWKLLKKGIKYKLSVYAKTTGKFNLVNRYEFPPPIAASLFYGDVFIIGYKKGAHHKYELVDLDVDMWKKFCRQVFQYEDLQNSEKADELEIDDLEFVPSHKKTKHGYLLDDFVVEDDDAFA